MKRLPIGVQTFVKIKKDNCVYVDKTGFALKLIQGGGGYYFLSRPRRFGKSLFLDTLAEIFLGHRELFEGLYIYDKYDFKPHPVIRISFGSGDYAEEEIIHQEITRIFERNERELGIECRDKSDARGCLEEMIVKAYDKYGERVVILIDEYDKPILDNITNRDMAVKARSILKNFYGVIKDSDRYIRFVFITGVSKFSKLNLFSGLNNLEDITIDNEYAEICGYTHSDLKTVFKEYLIGVDMEMVRRWYNGYNYFGEKVYNPYDILLFIAKGHEFRNYWWNTGNPAFLIDMLREKNYYIPRLEGAEISEEELDVFDVGRINVLSLFWQTGYLTFKKKIIDEFGGIRYTLGVPNLEIQRSLNSLLVDYLTGEDNEKFRFRSELSRCLRSGDFESFIRVLRSIFASIPYQNYARNIIAQYEGYYSSVVYVYLSAIGYEVIPEDNTNRGRIDLTLKLPDKVVIIEFKVDKDESAIKQIMERRYFEKYEVEGKKIYLLGIKFDSKERNIVAWESLFF